jgi:hypothetical protein
MVSEKQVVAILALIGATATFGFAIFGVYLAFKNNSQTVKV